MTFYCVMYIVCCHFSTLKKNMNYWKQVFTYFICHGPLNGEILPSCSILRWNMIRKNLLISHYPCRISNIITFLILYKPIIFIIIIIFCFLKIVTHALIYLMFLKNWYFWKHCLGLSYTIVVIIFPLINYPNEPANLHIRILPFVHF